MNRTTRSVSALSSGSSIEVGEGSLQLFGKFYFVYVGRAFAWPIER